MVKEALYELKLSYGGEYMKTVRVYVPEHEESEQLPVIYMTDGQNLFEDDRPYQFGCWYTREAIREARAETGKDAIIVGIHNDEGPAQRTNELTPKVIGDLQFPPEMPEQVRKMMDPKGEGFAAFVTDTVMPEIEKRFPVRTGRSNTAFCGSSSGGLMAYFIALDRPDVFGASGVFSPAFPMYADVDVIRWTKEKASDPSSLLYVYSGAADPLEHEIYEITKKVCEAIADFYPQDKLITKFLPEQRHHEAAWATVFKEFLQIFLAQC